MTEDEIYDIIEDMTEEGSLDEEQGRPDLFRASVRRGHGRERAHAASRSGRGGYREQP